MVCDAVCRLTDRQTAVLTHKPLFRVSHLVSSQNRVFMTSSLSKSFSHLRNMTESTYFLFNRLIYLVNWLRVLLNWLYLAIVITNARALMILSKFSCVLTVREFNEILSLIKVKAATQILCLLQLGPKCELSCWSYPVVNLWSSKWVGTFKWSQAPLSTCRSAVLSHHLGLRGGFKKIYLFLHWRC